MKVSVGFIGVGHMGYPMCSHLVKAGYPVTIFDLVKKNAQGLLDAGAKWAESIPELAGAHDYIVTVLPGPKQFETIVHGEDGLLANLPKGSAIMDLTTNSPYLIRDIFAEAEKRELDLLDASMSGGVNGAASRRITLMVGGKQEIYEKCRAILETMSDNVVYMGSSGAGNVAKIVNNLISLAVSGLVGEALMLGVKNGIDLKLLFETIVQSSGNTWRMQHSFSKFLLKGNLNPGFDLDLALKDLTLAKNLADHENIDLPFLNLALAQYTEASNKGWGKLHSEAVVKLLEEKTGIELRFHEVG
jgi:3-hydroxyisobutyrate dehydrogenase-like beta-hydroxyacid dehydrogenase